MERMFQEIQNTGATFTIIASPAPFTFDSEDSFFTGLIHLSVPNKIILNRLIQNLSKVNGIDKIIREYPSCS